MKPSQRYTTLLAASLVLAGPALAQSDRPSSSSADTRKSEMSKGDMSAIKRVTKDSLDHRFTAKDLIGAAVYDPAGEKIGDIADIGLQGAVPGSLVDAYTMDKAADRKTTRTDETTASGAAGAVSRAISDAESRLSHATLYLSVGGLLGIGDDVVSVPASQLNYNAASDRFELPLAKADVVARAEAETDEGYAADTDRPAATRAGKQSFADEASRVKNALQSDPQTSAFAQKVTVTAAEDAIHIRGMVDNKEQEKRILEAARRATSLDVEDNIEVRE